MKINTKGELINTFVIKKKELAAMSLAFDSLSADVSTLEALIICDSNLLDSIQEGGIYGTDYSLVCYCEEKESLVINKCVPTWELKQELSSEQIKMIGGNDE